MEFRRSTIFLYGSSLESPRLKGEGLLLSANGAMEVASCTDLLRLRDFASCD